MIQKSIQYNIFCENWHVCNNFTDYQELKSPRAYFKKLGYKLIDGVWYCKECAETINRIRSKKLKS